jgi:2-oxoglutarate dehydrogenase E2 component (dihydrolipoamide succinyltransferase)
MAQIEIRLPKMGESVTEATITNWLKNIGDTVEIDEPLVEVATDKVDNELPSEAGGVLIKQFFQKDEVAQVGDVIALISTDGDASAAIEPTTAVVSNAVQEITKSVEVVAASVN